MNFANFMVSWSIIILASKNRKNSCQSTVYVFIFVGVKFCGFRGHLLIHENNIFVNPQKFFTLWIHENFSCSVAALLAQRSISFKAPPYSLLRDDGAIKICTISLSFITETAKRSEFFLLYVISLPYLLILVIKLVITLTAE